MLHSGSCNRLLLALQRRSPASRNCMVLSCRQRRAQLLMPLQAGSYRSHRLRSRCAEQHAIRQHYLLQACPKGNKLHEKPTMHIAGICAGVRKENLKL